MIRRPPRSTRVRSSAASDVYKRQIETSGLALPKPLLQALNWPAIRNKVFINGVVTLVDGYALSNGSPVGDLKSINEQMTNDNSIDHITPIDELFRDQLISADLVLVSSCLLYTSPSPRDRTRSRMPSSA